MRGVAFPLGKASQEQIMTTRMFSDLLDVETIGTVTVAHFRQRTILAVDAIEAVGDRLLGLIREQGARKLVLDFNRVESLTSSMLGSAIGCSLCRVAFSIAASIRRSRGVTNRIASPVRPALPVRPTRCTYDSVSVGMSKFTTWLIRSTSRPRAATSVATRMSSRPARSCSTVRSRRRAI